MCGFRGKAHHVEELGRQVRIIAKSVGGIVDGHWVGSLELDPANSRGLHVLQFGSNFLPRSGWPKPPPPHHDATIIGWMLESVLDLPDGGSCLC